MDAGGGGVRVYGGTRASVTTMFAFGLVTRVYLYLARGLDHLPVQGPMLGVRVLSSGYVRLFRL